MSRHTTFKFRLAPTAGQQEVLARHAGGARFAFNQCLGLVKTALDQRHIDPETEVPWTGFDLIKVFNAWKKTEDAGRVFVVGGDGGAEVLVTGLSWRNQVYQQVFEEAAVDLGKGLKAWPDSRPGKRKGKTVGFPRFKKKTVAKPSFRLRNKQSKARRPTIRVGDNDRPRSVTLPGMGQIAVDDDTRRLRRMIGRGRARCGHSADRDCNAAVNLARWGQIHYQASPEPRTPKQRGRATNARRRDGTDRHLGRAGETSPNDAGTDVHTAPAA